MVRIWANRLIAGTKTWSEVPSERKEAVKAELQSRVASGDITQAAYDNIVGE